MRFRWNVYVPVTESAVMAVNLSGKQFRHSNLIGEVAALLKGDEDSSLSVLKD